MTDTTDIIDDAPPADDVPPHPGDDTGAPPDGADPGDAEAVPAGFRSLPHNIEAEKALLGALMVNNRVYEKISEYLRGEHFAFGPHGRIYEACAKLIERGQIADPVTLKRYFEQDESLSEIGGPKYLMELANSAVGVINAGEYGRLVYDLFLKRELIQLGETVVNRAYEADVTDDASNQIESAEQYLYDLATKGEAEGGFQTFRDSVVEAISIAEIAHKREGALAGVTTGLRDLDKMLGGLHNSDLVILAGRPSMGKTALVTNVAFNAAHKYQETNGEEGAVVGFFSLEMSSEQLAARILSEQANISSDRMRKGELSNDEFTRLVGASQMLHQMPIFIDDTPGLTVSALRTRARRLQRQHGLHLIIVDYLQLITGNPNSRNDGRVNEVSEITRGLKTLAKELNVPVIALSQLSRAVEQREPPRPQLSDLRESGSIEQDADVVMFIYREEYYMERKRPGRRADEVDDKYYERERKWEDNLEAIRNMADVIIAKQRHGPIGDVKLAFFGEFTRFADLDTQHSSGGDGGY